MVSSRRCVWPGAVMVGTLDSRLKGRMVGILGDRLGGVDSIGRDVKDCYFPVTKRVGVRMSRYRTVCGHVVGPGFHLL